MGREGSDTAILPAVRSHYYWNPVPNATRRAFVSPRMLFGTALRIVRAPPDEMYRVRVTPTLVVGPSYSVLRDEKNEFFEPSTPALRTLTNDSSFVVVWRASYDRTLAKQRQLARARTVQTVGFSGASSGSLSALKYSVMRCSPSWLQQWYSDSNPSILGSGQ